LRRSLTRDELAGAGVSEVRSVGPLDADTSITGFPSCEWSAPADHCPVLGQGVSRDAREQADR
jgi:hypothetical protein